MVVQAKNAVKLNPKFFEKYFPSLENLSDMFPKGSGGINPLQWKTYEPFRKNLLMLQNINLSDDEKAKYFENDPEALKIINGPDSEIKKSLLIY